MILKNINNSLMFFAPILSHHKYFQKLLIYLPKTSCCMCGEPCEEDEAGVSEPDSKSDEDVGFEEEDIERQRCSQLLKGVPSVYKRMTSERS